MRSRWPDRPASHRFPRTRRLATLLAATAAVAGLAVAAPLPALAAAAVPGKAAAAPVASPPGPLSQGQALAQARQTGKPVLVDGATTVSSTLTANPNGTLTVTESNMPVRKRSGTGWAVLDPTLHRNADGSVSPAVTTGSLRLSGGGMDPMVAMTSGGRTLAMTFPGRLPAPVLSGATATYPGVLPGVDLVVTADDQGGFDDVLVVRNATAAASPALRHLAFRVSATGGLTFRTDASGDLTAVNRAGRPVFSQPAAVMWDSRTAPAHARYRTQPATAGLAALRDGQPAASSAAAPGQGARIARVGARYGNGTVTYSPDESLLAGKGTAYPVYIDPWVPAAGGVEQYWAEVNTISGSTSDAKPSLLQVGNNTAWAACSGSDPCFTSRSFVTMSIPSELYGATIESDSTTHPTLYLTDEISPTCNTSLGDFGVQVWRTTSVTSSTLPSWSAQNASGFWAAEQDEKAFAYGYSGCPAQSVGFNVTNAAQWAASGSHSSVTFGIRADSESDSYGWKQFSPTVTMSISFDKAPFAQDLQTSPGGACNGSITVGQGDVTLSATARTLLSHNSGALNVTFYPVDVTTGKVINDATTGKPFAALTGYRDMQPASITLTEANLENYVAAGTANKISWYLTITDGVLTTTEPATAPSAPCSFTYDRSVPGAPTVGLGSSGWTTQPAGPPTASIGTTATFTVTPDKGTTVTGFDYQVNGAAPTFFPDPGSAIVTLPVKPTAWSDEISVTGISAGGNVGQTAVLPFSATIGTLQTDGDMTGDGIPDLVASGGAGTGLGSGLWLATQQAGPGHAGDGTLSPATVNLGQFGDGITTDYKATDFDGAEVFTGLFTPDTGLQDAFVYYPPSNTLADTRAYDGQGVILNGNGDGTVLQDKDSARTTGVFSTDFTTDDYYAGGSADNTVNGQATGDVPLQLANGYNADPGNSASYPGLITINGDPNSGAPTNSTTQAASGYYLEYYENNGTTGGYAAAVPLADATPDGGSDWNHWQITTMPGPATANNPSGSVDMFLYNASKGELYLWAGYGITTDAPGFNGTDTYTSYLLTPSGSSTWQAAGTTFTMLRAASINGSGPALWAVSATGQATPWYTSALTAPTGSATTGTGTITAGTAQSLLSPTHDWRLGDGTDSTTAIGTTNTSNSSDVSPAAADTGTGTGLPLSAPSATANATWTSQNDLFKPAADLNDAGVTNTTSNPGTIITGSTGYLTETAGAPVNPSSDYTISAWVKPATLGGAILSQAGSSTSCYMLYIDTTTVSGTTYGRWNFRLSNANTSSPTWSTATAGNTYYVKLGAWTHITITYSSAANYIRLYVNGIPAASVTPSAIWSTGCNTFSLGRYLDNGGATHGIFQGEIADVETWAGTPLSPTEVLDTSGNHGYVLFPFDGAAYASASAPTPWQWTTQCGNMTFYQGQIIIRQPGVTPTVACTGTAETYLPSTVPNGCTPANATLNPQKSDGNLVTRCTGTAVWSSATSGNPGDIMLFQPDGNLVIYGPYGQSLWASGTQNAPIYS